MRRLVCTVLCLLLVTAAAASVGAQQFTGGVRGAIRDANGVIPGVTVTLTNQATNVSRHHKTHSALSAGTLRGGADGRALKAV